MSATVLWCYEGCATVNAPDRVLGVIAGDLVIAPQGAFYSGSGLVCELRIDAHGEQLYPELIGSQTRRVHLSEQWQQQMLGIYSRYLHGVGSVVEALRPLLEPPVPRPQMPTSEAAHRVAQELVAHPATKTELKEFAEQLGVSARTIQRQFRAETGLVFSEWRAGHRVYVAHGLVSAGMNIAEASALVGFGAVSSLTRAFKRHTGTTPRARARLNSRPQEVSGMTVYAHPEHDRVLWMAAGTATVTTAGYCRFVGAGETITVPAGTQTQVEVAADSVALPVAVENRAPLNNISDALRAVGNYRQECCVERGVIRNK